MLLNPIEKKSSRGVSDKGNNVGILTPAITGGTAYGKTLFILERIYRMNILTLTIHIDLKEQVQKRRQMLYLHYLYMI